MDTTSSDTTDLAPRAPDSAPAIQPSYAQGFDGMATQPFDEQVRKVLAEHVPPEAVEIKPNGIVFVPGVFYRRQLTKAFGAGGWAIVPRGVARVMGDVVIYPGALFCLGRFVAEAVGECAYRQNSQMSYASCLEGAKTDALSRCCKDLGMATELWDAGWRDEWKKNYAETYRDDKGKTCWRSREGKPLQDIDLMAGAGGVAPKEKVAPPKAAASAKGSPPAATAAAAPAAPAEEAAPAAPKATADTSAQPSSVSTKTTMTSDDGATSDDGTSATQAQRDAIAKEMRSLGWKRGYVRDWLAKFTEAMGDRVESLDALTAKQADAVLKAFA